MFYSKTKPRETVSIAAGKKEKPTYSIKVDENGHKTVHQTGMTNFYKKIQENAEDCKIENILKRAQLGDTSALNRKIPQWIDATNMPTNLAEAQQAIINLENIFASLPLEVRKEYNFSAEQYIADFGSTKWNNLMGLKPVEKPMEKPVENTEKVVINE